MAQNVSVITVEQAKAQGVSKTSLIRCIEWHKQQAAMVKSAAKERHFKIIGKLRKVVDEL